MFLGALFVPIVLFFYPSHAFVQFDLEIADIEGTNWAVRGVRLVIKQLRPDAQELKVWVKNIQLPKNLGVIQNVNVHCSSAKIDSTLLECPQGWMHFDHSQLGSARFPVDFTYEFNGNGKMTFSKLTHMGGHLAGQIRWQNGRWLVNLEGKDVEVKRLYGFFLHTLVKASKAKFSDLNFESTGSVKFNATLSGDGKGLHVFALKGKAKSFGFTNASSTQVGEGLIAEVTLAVNKVLRGWQVEVDMGLNQGQLYKVTCP